MHRLNGYIKAVVFAALALASGILSVSARPDDEKISFPQGQDLGALSLEKKTDECPYLFTIKPPFARARGTVYYAAGYKLSLEPSYTVSQNPQLLTALNQPAIVALRFRSLPVDDNFVAHLRKFKYLKKISLDQTDISDHCLKDLAMLTQLQELNINMTLVKGPGLKDLSPLKNLVSLYCNHNNLIGGSIEALEALTSLEVLDISGSNVDDRALAAIGKLTNLTDLRISDNAKISDAGLIQLKNLTALKHLSLHGLHISPGALATLKCTKLKTLTLSQNPTVEQMALLQKTFPHCWIKVPHSRERVPVDLFSPLH